MRCTTLVPGFGSGGTSERTLVPVFVPGEHPPKPPFWKATLLGSSESSKNNQFTLEPGFDAYHSDDPKGKPGLL